MGVHEGKFRLTLPGKEYMAVRIRKIGDANDSWTLIQINPEDCIKE